MYPKIASLLTMSSSNVTSTYNVIEAGKSLLEPLPMSLQLTLIS